MKREDFGWSLVMSAAVGAALAGCTRADRAEADAAPSAATILNEDTAAATALPFALDDPAFPAADWAGPNAVTPPFTLVPESSAPGDLQPNPS